MALTETQQRVIDEAFAIMESMVLYRPSATDSPKAMQQYLRLRLGHLEHEVFAVVFLDAHMRPIEVEEMFRGSVTQATVYPREVVKAALRHNAVSVVLCHNHPSGESQASSNDIALTKQLKSALELVDVCVADHVIVTPTGYMSFAERGLI